MAIANRCADCGRMIGVKAHVCPPLPPRTEWRRRANEQRRARRAAAREHREQFDRDLRGDHDSPMSYRPVVMGPPDTTPTVAEILSREA